MGFPQRLFTLSLGLMVASSVSPAAETNDFPPARKAVECTARLGLPNFFAKAAKGGDVRVAYLGGSITAQPGYRVKSRAYFSNLYPNTKFVEINAAIGGTGSDLGVFRIDHDVFVGKPDLMFVEFVVNDAGAPPTEIVKWMEGIVRKTYQKFPECDIVFVYTFNDPLVADLKAGRLNRSAATMEVVADHYGIPSIHMGLGAIALLAQGKLLIKGPEAKMDRVSGDELNVSSPLAAGADGMVTFSADGTHPYLDTGHRLYNEAIMRSVPLLQKVGGATGPKVMPPPLDPKNYQNTSMVSLDKLKRSGSWTLMPTNEGLGKNFMTRVDSLWKAEPGATVSFRFKGSAAKAYDLLGPDCGKIEITVDGTPFTRARIDGYCTYSRLGLVGMGADLKEEAIHEVTVKVLDEKIDKEKTLFERNRGDFAKNPAKYGGLYWYVGAIFINGELIP